METHLLLSLESLSIEGYSPESQKSVKILFSLQDTSETLDYPFTFPLINKSLLENNRINLKFYQKNELFAAGQLEINTPFPSSIESFIYPEFSSEANKNNLKPIGKLKITLTKTSDPDLVQSNLCSEIALNLQKLVVHQRSFSLKEVENLRVLIIGLNSKLKTLILLQTRVENLENFSKSCLEQRENLQSSVLNTCEKLENHNKVLDSKFQALSGDIKIRSENYLKLEEKFREKCLQEDSLNSQLQAKDSEIFNLKSQLKNLENLENFTKTLQSTISGLELDRDALRTSFKNSIESFNTQLERKDLEILERESLISQLEFTISAKNQEILSQESKFSDSQSCLFLLKSRVEELEKTISGYSELESQRNSLEHLTKAQHNEIVSLQSSISRNFQSSTSSISQLNQEKQSLSSSLKSVSVSLSKSLSEAQEKTHLYRSEQIVTQDLRAKFSLIQQKLCNTLDISKLFTQVKYLSSYMSDLRDKLVEDNDELVRQVLKASNDYLSVSVALYQIREVIDDRDNEINILRDLIADLQNKTIYYPVKDDPVDEAIADYLNSRSEPLPVTFIREEYGVYLFGTKKVFIKLETGKIISKVYLVRVGGGYMRIDEFVNTYTAIELDKINERKNERNKPGRKALMGKVLDSIIGEKCVNKEVSNEHASKILHEALSSQSSFSKCLAAPRKNSGTRPRVKTFRD